MWEMQCHEAVPMCQVPGLSSPAHPPAANLLHGTDLPAPAARGQLKDLQPCRAR